MSGDAAATFTENGTGLVEVYEASNPDAATTLTRSVEGPYANLSAITKNIDGYGELILKTSPNFEDAKDAVSGLLTSSRDSSRVMATAQALSQAKRRPLQRL